MPTFLNLLKDIKDLDQCYAARINSIKNIEEITKRPLIVYAANIQKRGFNVPNSIDNSDITGFSDLIEDINSDKIDVFLHSPGGSAEATERIVNLLRANFSYIRFFIPNAAYSAATMLALSGDEILMDERSTLGPIDPQIIMATKEGTRSVPTQDILDGFKELKKALKKDPDSIAAYLPMIDESYLYLLETCKNTQKLARVLVQEWLEKYMLKMVPKNKKKAKNIAKKFAKHKIHLSHARTIGIEKCEKFGLDVKDLRKMPELRKELWRLYCLIEILFDRSTAVKLFENSHGTSWARHYVQRVIQVPTNKKLPKKS